MGSDRYRNDCVWQQLCFFIVWGGQPSDERVPKDERERLNLTLAVTWSSSSQGHSKSSQCDGKRFQLNLDAVLNPNRNRKFQCQISHKPNRIIGHSNRKG